jgi:predicted nucleic acid-binding protein
MGFVLDASIALSWCFSDESTVSTSALLDRLEKEIAFVPGIWPLEIGNILISAERRHRIRYADITQCLELFGKLNIEIDNQTSVKAFHEILSLAHSEKLTTYDAAYLELAMRRGLPLASKDLQLCKVADRLGVLIVQV